MNIRHPDPSKITVNNWSIQKKTTGTTFPLYKKERERRSHAFPSDSNPVAHPLNDIQK